MQDFLLAVTDGVTCFSGHLCPVPRSCHALKKYRCQTLDTMSLYTTMYTMLTHGPRDS